MAHTVRIVVQARVASTRLPGKILSPLAGEPMLAHVVRRLAAAGEHTGQRLQVIVATTPDAADDATERLCRELKIGCVRGPAEDVLKRYLQATADLSEEDIVMRATADNPLYCPRRTAEILHEHVAAAADYTCITNLSYVVPEVMRVGALRRMAAMADDPYCREHVTPYFRQRPEEFRVRQLPPDWQGLRPDVRLTVDTPEEYQRMERIFTALSARGVFALEDVYAYMDQSHVRSPSGLRVAVVGFGSIGRRHFENLGALGVTNRILVRRPHPNPAFSPPQGTPVVHADAEAIAIGLDAAIICNPTRLHLESARRYVSARVPVLIEKPLCAADDLAGAQRLLASIRRRRVPLGMAYCMRYHPAYRLAHEALAEGRIGRVFYAKAWFESYLPDWHPWEDYRQSYAARSDLGGGALPTLDHEIDFLHWCLGEPREVVGKTSHSGAVEVETNDHAALLFRYGGGTLATAVLSLCRRDRSRGFEFVGEQGTLQFRMEEARLQLLRGNDPPITLWHDPAFDLNRIYLDMLADFLAALGSPQEMPVPLEAGLAAVRAACLVGAESKAAKPRQAAG